MPNVNVADAVETLEIVVADLPTTPELTRATYQALYAAQTTVFDAVRQHTIAKIALKDAEAQVWPGNNETERKVAARMGTAPARVVEQAAAEAVAAAEEELVLVKLRLLVLAKLRLSELLLLLRLAEYIQRGTLQLDPDAETPPT